MLETIVAIGLVTMGLVSALALITNSLFYVSSIQDRLIAVNLAAEGIEVVRNIRDNNWLQNKAWNDGLTTDGDYQVAYDSVSLASYGGGPLFLDSNGLYNYVTTAPNTATLYKRKISIANLSNYEIRVISEVSWQRKKDNYSSSTEDHLFNWR